LRQRLPARGGSLSIACVSQASNVAEGCSAAGEKNARMLWKLIPEPTISTPSSRKGPARGRTASAPGIEIALERERHHRNVGLWRDQQERDEHPVVEAAPRIGARGQTLGRISSTIRPASSGAPGAGNFSS
jgi:hypothetical protein